MNENRYKHVNVPEIPDRYKKSSLHIALELADQNKDWKTFKKLYDIAPLFLKSHLNMTDFVFDYNYKKLSNEEQINLFNYTI